jgi:glycosyltransferase involved in cell wall biosynthesis
MSTPRSTPARRVLMVSPHFPPDSSAAAHRVRLLAPHLADAGWQPTIVTVDPAGYEGRLDSDLASLVPASLDVVRAPVWPARWTRRVGLGDLGLRGLTGLARTCRARLARDRYDLLFITVYPVYPALLGPRLKRTFDVPFVLDYQDPWVGEWGRTVGGGANGEADWKSRASRSLGVWLEPRAVLAADALVAVSQGTIDGIVERIPEAARVPHAIVPLGFEPNDFDQLRSRPRPVAHFDPRDGLVHICYVGTLLPKGIETLRLLLRAVAHARRFSADAQRIRLHFFGTSNQSTADRERVLPLARECGLADVVTELPGRLDYLDALSVLTQASAIVLLGSSETHYTASKLYPALLARRPLLTLFNEASSVVSILRGAARQPSVRIVAYGERIVTHARIDEVARHLIDLGHGCEYRAEDVDLPRVMELSAGHLARRLAGLFDRVVEARAATSVAA